MDKKESVIIDRGDEPRSSGGLWAAVGVTILIFLVLFLLFGGLSYFTGNQGGTPTTENPVTPTPTAPVPTTPESPTPTTGQ